MIASTTVVVFSFGFAFQKDMCNAATSIILLRQLHNVPSSKRWQPAAFDRLPDQHASAEWWQLPVAVIVIIHTCLHKQFLC